MEASNHNNSEDVCHEAPDSYFNNDFPLRLMRSEEQGRYVIAKRDINCGEVVMSAYPYAYSASEEHKRMTCANCLQYQREQLLLINCPSCNSVYFCSDQCREDYSSIHDIECDALKRIQGLPIPDYWQRTTIRLIFNILLRKEMETNPKFASIKKIHEIKKSKPIYWGDMLLLISNYEHFDMASQWYVNELYKNTTEVLQCVREWDINAAELVHTICRLIENGFGIRQSSNDCIGYGIYPVASYYNHSCAPTCCVIQEGIELKVIAIRDIKQGEQVSISYITLASDTPARRDQLQIDYNFLCRCPRCSEFDKGEDKKKKGTTKKRRKERQNGEFKSTESSTSVSEVSSSYEERSGFETEAISNEYATRAMDNQFGLYENVAVADVMPIDQAVDPALDDIIKIFEDTTLISTNSTYVAKNYEKDWFWRNCLCDSLECQGKGLWMVDLKTKKTVCNLCRQEKPSTVMASN
eukprot:TRINITY_DN5690_c0_g1_i1.p1 TRINITY_DN5690_c0_g1~~TRINITY_DN5690_c0_g1_i1.p1  ORF type:complete len:468 (-),score=-1.10 TRINITY_DN5690_c0_g1_i1:6-1409(-)